ncbi:MAG: WD40 repeat domain-containing protein [Gammaproteobacteria bacterium]
MSRYVRRCGILNLILVGCGFIPAPVVRGETSGFPTEPILRLNPEGYMARITSLSVDEQGRFIATGHTDKTVCLWDLQTGRLERVLRVPLGPELEIFAVALSPKARHVAVVATGWDGDLIYVFDGQSGRLEHRIKKDHASYLTYSPDGRYLAATTRPSRTATGHAVGGLSVYETSRYRTIGQDVDNSGWADFDRDNRLVTIGWNGDIRLYSAGEYSRPYLTRGAPGGKESFLSGTFSPDGQFIALAYSGSIRVDVVSAKTLSRAYSPNTERLGIGPVYRVDWSPDGRYLYAGKYTKSGPNTVIRWSQAGRGDITEYSLAEDEMIGTLMGGRLLVIGTERPLLALVDADGKKRWVRRNEGANFRDQEGRDGPGLALSRTGDIVEFGFQRFGKRRAWFDLRTRRLDFEPPTDASLTGPLLAAPGLTVTGWNVGDMRVLTIFIPITSISSAFARLVGNSETLYVMGVTWSLTAITR